MKKIHTHRTKSASESMVSDVPVVLAHHTLAEVRRHIERGAAKFNTLNYIYVVNNAKKLTGVLSLRQLFELPPTSVADDVCTKEVITVHPETHQETAANLALKHNVKALPVVSKDGVFLGEIPSDAILSILYTEMREDMLRHAGIRHGSLSSLSILHSSVFTSVRHRIPWLLIGLLGGLFAAKVIGFYQATLSRNLLVAAFIPLIVYMSSAVGVQMEAYIIRDLATEKKLKFGYYFFRHLLVVLCLGVILSILLAALYGLTTADWSMAGVVSLSLFVAVCSSICTGLLIPYFFSRLSFDPADASGPIATIVQDILSIIIYLSIATALL